jgi:preprotein translocase subunit SecD
MRLRRDSSGNGGYKMTLKQSAIRDIESGTLDTSIETIRERIDNAGRERAGDREVRPGRQRDPGAAAGRVDPGRVENIIQSTAKLEIHAVVGVGVSGSEARRAGEPGGIPPDEELLKGIKWRGRAGPVLPAEALAIVEGTDFRDAQPSTDENGRPDITFNLTTEAGDRFYKYTDANKGTGQMAIVLDNQVREVATIEGAIRDQGRITGGFTQDQAADLS